MRRFSLQMQLFIGIVVLLVVAVGGIGFLNYTLAIRTLRQSLEEHIHSLADLSSGLLEQEVKSLALHYLKGINTSFLNTFYETFSQVKRGRMKEQQAITFLQKTLLSISISKSGYMAVLDSKGHVVIHPKLAPGTDLSSYDFIQESLRKKEGFIEYSWKNPGEKIPRNKVLYVSYYPEKDWYIFSTAYREDFSDMFDLSSLQDVLGETKENENMKKMSIFIIDTEGTIISHDTLKKGENILSLLDDKGSETLKTMRNMGNGFIRFRRKEKNTMIPVIAYFKKLPNIPWIVVAEIPENLIHEKTLQLRIINFSVILLAFVMMSLVSYWISRSLRNSLKTIQTKLANISSGTEKADLRRRIEIHLQNEVGDIAQMMNRFLDRIHNDLLSVKQTSLLLKSSTARSQEIMVNTIKKSLESIKNKIIQIDYSTENATSGIEELTANLEEMSRSIQSIMNNMERQASAVEESASSIEEMVRNIENITATTIKSQTISTNLNNVAQEGGEAVKQAINSIKEVSEYSQQIMKMLQIISNIAKQTNLLAMNAAIEAAHAGEAGKGFAIVAEEIRRLSEDTNKNAKEIGEVINVIVDRIANSVKLSEKAGIGLDMIMTYSQQNVQIANQITIAMSEQNHGAKEILDSTHEMVKITEEVKLAITEQNTATHDFSDAVRGLRDLSIENKQIIQEHLKDLNNLLTGLESIQEILNQVVANASSLDELLGNFILREETVELPSHAMES
ncbi:MAG: methyl-accepting chemotaxis protein [Brevinematales bacterium]